MPAETRLSDAAIKGIKRPANGRTEYFDSIATGLALRVSSTGAAS